MIVNLTWTVAPGYKQTMSKSFDPQSDYKCNQIMLNITWQSQQSLKPSISSAGKTLNHNKELKKMNKVLLALMALMIASTSNALVADKFKCSMEIKAVETRNSAKQEKEFFIARLPALPILPTPNVRLTVGRTQERMTLDTPAGEFGANLNFYFKHAVNTNPDIGIEPRQFTCLGFSTDFCPHGSGSGLQLCSQGQVACLESSDPFSTDNGWALTSMVIGIPAFNEKALAPVTHKIIDDQGKTVGVANLVCQYLGTYN